MNAKTIVDPGSHRTPWDVWSAPAVFITFVVIGCAYILVAKEYGIGQVYVTFIPVVFMLAYAALMFLARLLRLRDDQAGDNLYYMGFLYTLTSLGASLYHFDAAGDAEYIVQNFGIAIASTITGIALRVIFNQMRRDPVEVERVARLELADAARRVRTELDQTVLEFNHFRRTTLQSMEEGFHEIGAHVDTVSKKLLAGLEEVTAKSAAPLEAAAKRTGDTIGEMTKTVVAALEASAKELSNETARLSRSATAISETLDGVSDKLAAMQSPDEVIQIKLDPTIKGLSGAVDRFSKRLDEHDKGIETAIAGIRGATEAAAEAVGQGAKASAASEAAMRDAVSTCLQAVRDLSATLEAFGKDAGTRSGRVEGVLKRTEETLIALKEATEAASERQTGHVEALSRLVSDASQRQTAHMESMSRLVPAMEQSANSIHVAVEKLTPAPPPAPEPRRGFWPFGGISSNGANGAGIGQ